MATYKVPQDVEADDKLIGPFSFRQFVYLIVVALSGALAWGLAQIFIGLAVIPLPVILLFGALALPLRKDQPMEIYLAAIVSFYLKPHKRFWDPEGVETLIEIDAPKIVEEVRIKNLSESEAEKRLGFLANIVDSGGWAIRGSGANPDSAMISDVFYDSQNVQDVLDTNNTVAQSFDYLITQTAEKSRQEALDKMRQTLVEQQAPQVVAPAPAGPVLQPSPVTPVVTTPQSNIFATPVVPDLSPYPQEIHQKVIQPIDDMNNLTAPVVDLASELSGQPQAASAPAPTPAVNPTPNTSDIPIAPDIMNLANNSDVSVETLAHEAQRLKKKAEDEVVISLR